MAVLAMCLYDPPGESRHELLDKCLKSIQDTVDLKRHSLLMWDNGTTDATKAVIKKCLKVEIPGASETVNLGTARGINRLWKKVREKDPGMSLGKVDSDIVFNTPGWLDVLEDAISRDHKLGIACCKRKDISESPHMPDGHWAHSDLIQLPHVPGQRWIHAEVVHHCMGSAQLYSPRLLDRIGYLVQMGLYGFDDSLAAARCKAAGFYSAFICGLDIDHIDPGGTPYQKWKEDTAAKTIDKFYLLAKAIKAGQRDFYAGPDEDWE